MKILRPFFFNLQSIWGDQPNLGFLRSRALRGDTTVSRTQELRTLSVNIDPKQDKARDLPPAPLIFYSVSRAFDRRES